jgi:hypothetical protein
MPRVTVDSRSSFLRLSAEVLAEESPLPFQELARRVLATGRLASTGRTPRNTLFSLLWRAHHRGYTVDGKQFALFKVGWRLWVAIDETPSEPQ